MSAIRNDSGRLRRIAGLIRKETRQVLRDPSNVLLAVVLPLMLLFLFGYGITFDPRFYDVGLVVEQQTPASGSFAASLSNSPYFHVRMANDRRVFEDDLVAGSIAGIVVLPADFEDRAYRGYTAPIQIIVDGADPNTATLVRDYVELLWVNWLTQESISLGQPLLLAAVSLEPQVLYNLEVSSRHYLVPGSIAIILTLIGALLTALVIAREWERGTMEALLATPLGIIELLIGKLVPYFLLGMGSMILSVAVAVQVFGVPFRGSYFVLAIVSAVFMWGALGQGLLISTVTRNQLVAAQVSAITAFLPAFYFSGFVFEIDGMPWALQLFSFIVPARYFVSSLQTLFLTGDVPDIVVPDLLSLGAIGAVFFLASALLTKTRLD